MPGDAYRSVVLPVQVIQNLVFFNFLIKSFRLHGFRYFAIIGSRSVKDRDVRVERAIKENREWTRS